jgi:hypothetical protein
LSFSDLPGGDAGAMRSYCVSQNWPVQFTTQ